MVSMAKLADERSLRGRGQNTFSLRGKGARVVSLIEDLAELEARENEEDLAAARAALGRIAAGEEPVPWDVVNAELDALHDQA